MKKIALIPFILVYQILGFAQTFNKSYSVESPTSNEGTNFISSKFVENSLLVAAASFGNGIPNVLPLLTKIDSNGDTLWTKKLKVDQSTLTGAFDCLEKIGDNRWIMTGIYFDYNYNVNSPREARYLFFYIFDENGDSICQKTFIDSTDNINIKGLAITKDKHIMVSGTRFSSNLVYCSSLLFGGSHIMPDTISLFLSKFDTNGNEIWSKNFFSLDTTIGYNNQIYNMVSGNNKSVIISGFGNYLTKMNPGIIGSNFTVKLDSNGNVIWAKNYRFNDYPSWKNTWITHGPNNTYYFAYTIATQPIFMGSYGDAKVLLGQMDAQGDTLWTKTLTDSSSAIIFTEPQQLEYKHNKLYLLGRYYWGYYKPMLMILDTNGNIQSYRRFEGPDSNIYRNELYGLQIHEDKSIVMTGYQTTFSYDSTTGTYPKYAKGWVVKTDSVGCLIPGCETIDTMWTASIEEKTPDIWSIKVNIYPNPTINSIFLETELTQFDLEIISANGQLVLTKNNINSTEIDVSQFKSGLYYVRVIKNNSFKTYKIIKQ